MIQQEIKLYEEPTTITYGNNYKSKYNGTLYGSYYMEDIPSELDFNNALIDAKKQFKIGQRYKYKSSGSMVEIIAFETDRHKAAIYQDSPGVLVGRRVTTTGEYAPTYNYSVPEILEMEEVLE